MNFGWVDMEEGGGRTTNTLLSPSILSNVQSFHGSTTYSCDESVHFQAYLRLLVVTLAVACIWINLQASGCQLSMRKTTASAFAALCSICCAFVYPLGFLLLGVAPHFRINSS